jgi:hypothetical protein
MRFKAMIVCAVFCNSAILVIAQNKSDRYHEFGSVKRWHLKGYIGPLVALSSVEGSFSVDLGATGGFIINNDFFAGIYGQKLVNNPSRTDLTTIGYPTYTDGEVDMIHSGGVLGYINKPGNAIHWGLCGSAGVGILSLTAKDPVTLKREKIYGDRVYIVIPRLFTEMNLTKWFKVNVSAGYRFLGKVNGKYINQDHEEIMVFDKAEYTKPEFSVSLLFGAFGIRSGVLD